MPDNVYDAVRYSNNPYAQTHPERLATVAILHGLTPPDPFTRARARDRLRRRRQPDGDGGGDAGHPRDRASIWPRSRSPRARRAIAEIGLGNIELRQGDLRDLADGSLGEFDYIVAHGVYSWIPAGRARRAAGHDPREPGAPTASPTSPSTPIPAATSGGCCATSGSGTRARSTASDPAARAAKAQELYKFLAEHRMTSADTYGALLEREVPALADGADLPARPRRPLRPLASGLVRRVRRARRRATSWPTSARPTSTACAARCCPRASSPSCGSSPAATGSRSRTTPTC